MDRIRGKLIYLPGMQSSRAKQKSIEIFVQPLLRIFWKRGTVTSVRNFLSSSLLLRKFKTHRIGTQLPNGAIAQLFGILRYVYARKKRGYERRFCPVQKTSGQPVMLG